MERCGRCIRVLCRQAGGESDRDIYMEYISYCHYKGRKIRSIERRRKMEFLLLYEP